MSSDARVALVAATVLVGLAGCSHLLESRTINRFNGAVQQQDLVAIKDASSASFQTVALRDPAAIEAIKLLELPTGRVKVIEVKETTGDRREVTVEVGKPVRRLTFDLAKDEKTGRWLVDDLLLKQSRGGATEARSASEVIDLLLSVHEFQVAWRGGDRQQLLGTVSDGLASQLGDLPPAFLARIASRVVSGDGKTLEGRPRASLKQSTAQVRYDGPEGETILAMVRQDARWKVDDIVMAKGSRSRKPESIRHLAGVVAVVAEFLDAYNSRDREQLARVTATRFYRTSLSLADLSQVSLPRSDAIDGSTEVRLQQAFSDVLLKVPVGMVRVSLTRDAPPPVTEAPAAAGTGYRVSEVTLIDYDREEQRRLSAVYTARARMRVFSNALIKRSLSVLKYNSTFDFNDRVWKHLDATTLARLPLEQVADAAPVVSGIVFQGPVTEITVTQGSAALTYVLREQKGLLLVDDVLVPANRKPGSLKRQLERLIPLVGFASAIRNADISRIRRFVSDDFNRLVWHQLKQLPRGAEFVPSYLQATVSRIRSRGEDGEEVVLGDQKLGARVLLVKESGRFVIDDVELLDGSTTGTWLKQALRLEVARPQNATPAVSRTPPTPATPATPTPSLAFPAVPAGSAAPRGR